MRNLRYRLSVLEGRPGSELITLTMPDGRIETLRGSGDFMRDLFSGVCSGVRTPVTELVARSIASTEPGGGHLIELARAILNSPVD